MNIIKRIFHYTLKFLTVKSHQGENLKNAELSISKGVKTAGTEMPICFYIHFLFSKITAFCGQRVELSSNDWPFWKILKIDWLLDTQRQYEYSIRPTEYPCLSCSTSYYVRVDYSTCTYRRLESILCLLYLRKNGDAVFLKISTELPVLKYQRSILDDVGQFRTFVQSTRD